LVREGNDSSLSITGEHEGTLAGTYSSEALEARGGEPFARSTSGAIRSSKISSPNGEGTDP